VKRFWIIPLAVAMAIVIALPAAAVQPPDKPEKPGKPGSGPTNPPACEVTEVLYDNSEMPLKLSVAREYTAQWFELTATELTTGRGGRDLCVEVTVATGTLSDMNVALADYPDQAARRCGFHWPGGKINQGDVFNVGFSLDGYEGQSGSWFCGSNEGTDDDGGLAVLVMPKLHVKTDKAILLVKVGFAEDVAS
jgi:hypothetical protein